MKHLLILFSFCLSITAFAQEKFAKVRIALSPTHSLESLAALGLEVDHGIRSKGYFESDFSNAELQLLQQAGYSYTIMIEDVQAFYRNRCLNEEKKTRAVSCHPPIPTFTTPSAFNYGTMGSYLTLQEAYDELDSLAAAYPNLVSVKQPIGSYLTEEGRPLYYVKISDNVNTNENEPQVLYDAAHHAREVITVNQIIYFMQYLCENYNTNQEVKRLVDNIEFYFVPVVNPDGYEYNHTTNPSGGGMWRKNRRNNGGGVYGVDLNRNYGLGWGANNIGSSPTNTASTYRGPSAFSEPETQAMRDFCNAHQFRFAANYHSYSNLVVYPWGYLGTNCNDSVYYRALCADLCRHNFYKSGTDLETVGYSTNGSSDDWMYGETVTKPLMFAFTPEMGDAIDGFWPAPSRILPLCQESNFMNLTLARYALQYAQVEPITSRLTANTSGYASYEIRRLGLDTGSFSVTLSGLTPNVVSVGNTKVHSGLVVGKTYVDSISYTLQSGMANGDVVKLLLTCNSGSITEYDTITLFYGNVLTVYSNTCDNMNGFNNFGFNTDQSNYLSGTGSVAENASGNYSNNYDAEIQTTSIDLSQALHAELRYRCTWEVENSVDYVQIGASTNGLNYTTLCSRNTQPSADQTVVGEVYTGAVSDWKYEILNLDDYLGQSNVYLQWTFHSDAGLNMRGFNMDDLVVQKLSTNPMQLSNNESTTPTIFPIPSTDAISISGIQDCSFHLTDLTGHVLVQGRYTSPVDVRQLSNGMYLLHLENNKGQRWNLRVLVAH